MAILQALRLVGKTGLWPRPAALTARRGRPHVAIALSPPHPSDLRILLAGWLRGSQSGARSSAIVAIVSGIDRGARLQRPDSNLRTSSALGAYTGVESSQTLRQGRRKREL